DVEIAVVDEQAAAQPGTVVVGVSGGAALGRVVVESAVGDDDLASAREDRPAHAGPASAVCMLSIGSVAATKPTSTTLGVAATAAAAAAPAADPAAAAGAGIPLRLAILRPRESPAAAAAAAAKIAVAALSCIAKTGWAKIAPEPAAATAPRSGCGAAIAV